MNMVVDVKVDSFDQVNQVADCRLDCVNSLIQGITDDQANEHFNIDEGSLSNMQDNS